MKKVLILFVSLFLVAICGFTQTIENLDFISEFNDGLAAIKKDNQWAFINKDGTIVIDFRTDLVASNFIDGDYPIFKNERCLIKTKNNGISYFGYIDTSGKTVIEPQYLNASNFDNNEAIVLLLIKEEIGENDVLGKNIVYYKYYDVSIDINGHLNLYITSKGHNIILDKKYLRNPPKITSKKISDNLYTILNENKKWTIKKIKDVSNF